MKKAIWKQKKITSKEVYLAILIASLGYFVDVYDLILFSVVRVASLRDLAVPEDQLLSVGVFLLNVQLVGMLLGGFLWGILADKRGRLSVLLGSIALYSVANLLNGFINSIPQYALCRFFAGLGLAGELGTGVTLVCEMLPKRIRTLGTMIISSMGMLGGFFAALFGDKLQWHHSYILGGMLGLILLVMRFRMRESPLFKKEETTPARLGDVRLLVESPKRFLRYVLCILIGIPVWFILGIVATFSPELGKALNTQEPINAGTFILFVYLGSAIGSIIGSLASHYFQSHRKVILFFLLMTLIVTFLLLSANEATVTIIYIYAALLGSTKGLWPLMLANEAEQFGTNMRATVTTTVPNIVRASALPLSLLFLWLQSHLGFISAMGAVGITSIALAFIGVLSLKESFSKDLDFLEE